MTDMHYEGGSPNVFRDIVLATDQGVGRVLDTLSKHRLDRDTVVIFTSDNGGERFSKMRPLRGGKGELWEGGSRVQLIVNWPGRIRAGTVSRQVAVSMDFLPTMAALAGIATDPSYPPDGVDLSPQFFGGPPVDHTIFWMTPGERLAALSYPWKYLRNGALEYLYNLDEDPTEHANFKSRNPALLADPKARTLAWSEGMQKAMPAVPRTLVDQAEALETPKLPGR
jgi:arylsulfatase A-like enzyme